MRDFNWLRMILDARGVRQKSLAAAIGESPQNFSKVLNGRRACGRRYSNLKSTCREWFGLTDGDWANPPHPFFGGEGVEKAADGFFDMASEALLSWKWRSTDDIDIVLRAVDSALDCSDALSLGKILCVLEPLSDCLHERRDYIRWARWVRKAQQSLEFSSPGANPSLLQVLKLRCTALAGEIARHEKYAMNQWRNGENEDSLKNLIRPNFEAAEAGLAKLIGELGSSAASIPAKDILRYARFCRIRVMLQLGGYLSFSSVPNERSRAVALLKSAAEIGGGLVSEAEGEDSDCRFPYIGGRRRVFYVQSCILRRRLRAFAKLCSSPTVSEDVADECRLSAKRLCEESERLAVAAADDPGAGVRERRNLVRTLSWSTIFLLDCHRSGRGDDDVLSVCKDKTDKAARILRDIAGGRGAYKNFPVVSGCESAFGKLPFDTELAIRMFIEVRISPEFWRTPIAQKGVANEVALADSWLPLVRNFFEIADAYRHLFKSCSALYDEKNKPIPRVFVNDLYDESMMKSSKENLFRHSSDANGRAPLADPFAGVAFASVPSWPTQLDLTSQMLASRESDGNGTRSRLVSSRMAECMATLISKSAEGVRFNPKSALHRAVKNTLHRLHEADKMSAERNVPALYDSEIRAMQRPGIPFAIKEIADFETDYFRNRRGSEPVTLNIRLRRGESPQHDAVAFLEKAALHSAGLGFACQDSVISCEEIARSGGEDRAAPDNSILKALFLRWMHAGSASAKRTESEFCKTFGLSKSFGSKILSAQSEKPVPDDVGRKIAGMFHLDPAMLNHRVWGRFRERRERQAVKWLNAAAKRLAAPPPTAPETDVECETRFKNLLLFGVVSTAFRGMVPSDRRLAAAAELLPVISSCKIDGMPPASDLRSVLRSAALFEPDAPDCGTLRPARAALIERLASPEPESRRPSIVAPTRR